MRISSNQLSQYVLQGLNNQGEGYARVMEQMSSGYRINTISDDPLGSSILLGLKREQNALEQHQDNISTVTSTLEKSESYLDSSFNILLRVQELVLSANSGSRSDFDREAYASELASLRDTLVDFANASDEKGSYIFSGSLVDKPAIVDNGTGTLVYQGDSRVRQVKVGSGVSVPSNVSVQDIYFGSANFFDDLNTFIDDLNTPGSSAYQTSGAAMIDTLTTTMDNLNKVLTDIGGNISSISMLSASQADLHVSNENMIGNIRDLDYAEASTRVSNIQLALTATQKTYTSISNLSLFDYV